MSPPLEERGPSSFFFPNHAEHLETQQSLDGITNHFQGMGLSGSGPLVICLVCVICRKSTMQIQQEAVSDYLNKTAIHGETALKVEARKRAFIEGMHVGTILLLPGGVSQVAACDFNFYTFDHSLPTALPETLPI